MLFYDHIDDPYHPILGLHIMKDHNDMDHEVFLFLVLRQATVLSFWEYVLSPAREHPRTNILLTRFRRLVGRASAFGGLPASAKMASARQPAGRRPPPVLVRRPTHIMR